MSKAFYDKNLDVYEKYFDWAATTPLCSSAKIAMKDFIDADIFGNPSSPHAVGRKAQKAVEEAREIIAQYFQRDPQDIIFTSGGTEGNNLAIQGWARSMEQSAKKSGTICISPTAHHSMTESTWKATGNMRVQTLRLTFPYTQVDLNDLEDIMKRQDPNSVLVCVEMVNNETGHEFSLFPLIDLVHSYDNMILVDAVQGLPHSRGIVEKCKNVDYFVISSHKIFGPKGVGALICNSERASWRLIAPLFEGGEQEKGLRPGTYNTLGIVGFGAAFKEVIRDRINPFLSKDIYSKDRLLVQIIKNKGFQSAYPWETKTIPGFTNIILPVESAYVASRLSEEGFMVSTGAACSGSEENSHVLVALGLPSTHGLRIVVNSFNSERAIIELFDRIEAIVKEVLL